MNITSTGPQQGVQKTLPDALINIAQYKLAGRRRSGGTVRLGAKRRRRVKKRVKRRVGRRRKGQKRRRRKGRRRTGVRKRRSTGRRRKTSVSINPTSIVYYSRTGQKTYSFKDIVKRLGRKKILTLLRRRSKR